MSKQASALLIGAVAKRTGISVSAIRHYESEGLVHSSRTAGGQRLFSNADIRRISFVIVAQKLGFSLGQIRMHLDGLPNQRTPTKRDWEKISQRFSREIDERINALTQLKENLSGCIGCGCLSLKKCALFNDNDVANKWGAGPRYLMGNTAKQTKKKFS